MGNLVFLFLIYFFALFFIGTSIGVLDYLKIKMDDPFVNIVSEKIQNSYCDPVKMKRYFEDEITSLKDEYHIDAIDFFKRDFENFSDGPRSAKNEVLKIGVLDSVNHAIWKMIDSKPENFNSNPKNNLLFDTTQTVKYNQLLVLSEESAKSLDLGNKSTVFWRSSSRDNAQRVELTVSAVLKIIPGDLDAIMSEDLYEFLQAGGDSPSYVEWAYLKEGQTSIDTSKFKQVHPAPVHSGGYLLRGGGPAQHEILAQLPKLKLLSITGAGTRLSQNGICFQFDKLDQVEPFAEFLKEKREQYGCTNPKGRLEIDLDTIETKENLDLFNKFGMYLAIALSLVSIVLIVNYSLALLRLHISRNKKNLGTLTAFGYDNTKVTGLYLYISIVLLSLTFVLAYLTTTLLGDVFLSAILGFLDTNIASGALHFTPLHDFKDHPALLVGIALGVFIILPLGLISFQINRLLKLSPGDLVYDRKS